MFVKGASSRQGFEHGEVRAGVFAVKMLGVFRTSVETFVFLEFSQVSGVELAEKAKMAGFRYGQGASYAMNKRLLSWLDAFFTSMTV